ncbi:hypothetical protein NBC122_01279 [Chryseobacterium salivictor]|uniref:Uncharacterized protein n=1 Tax=Chryseobacterium salivictor TaxID=2547600 RepID=A0A4P6ZES8_9FLAO|nr:hypothetical protein NBC122_01279 [Chryseobacterium salivictor]
MQKRSAYFTFNRIVFMLYSFVTFVVEKIELFFLSKPKVFCFIFEILKKSSS